MKHVIVAHHHELVLKGNNRRYFERQLMKNMHVVLREFNSSVTISGGYGRTVLRVANAEVVEPVATRLSKVFGISNICVGVEVEQKIEKFNEAGETLLKDKKFSTIRVDTRRPDKMFLENSMEVNREVGGFLCERFGVRANMTAPDETVFIEIVDGTAFVYTSKQPGAGGLPSGVSGKVVSLLSAGFDSPVASWRMMRRGASVIFVHFHSMPYTGKESVDQVRELTKILTEFQMQSKLYIIPFADIQNAIVLHSPAPLRVVLYRRMMIRIAEEIARREKAEALITGEALGQVASQTLRNMRVIDEAATFPILRPLAGSDKEETMETARRIGTYNISKEPYDDCCSFLAPRSPETWAKMEQVVEAEQHLDIEAMMRTAIEKTERESYRFPEEVINSPAPVNATENQAD
jgi:thiamine biosynthesis protein ThiI